MKNQMLFSLLSTFLFFNTAISMDTAQKVACLKEVNSKLTDFLDKVDENEGVGIVRKRHNQDDEKVIYDLTVLGKGKRGRREFQLGERLNSTDIDSSLKKLSRTPSKSIKLPKENIRDFLNLKVALQRLKNIPGGSRDSLERRMSDIIEKTILPLNGFVNKQEPSRQSCFPINLGGDKCPIL